MAASVAQPDYSIARNELRAYASRALLRLRLQAAFDGLAWALTFSAWLLALLLLSDKLFSLKSMGVNVWPLWGWLSLLGVPFVLWHVFAPRLHARSAAALSDQRLHLHARLSTALTLDFSDSSNSAFGGAFLEEARRALTSVKVERAFPLRFPRALAWLALPAAAAACIFYFMPNQDVLGVAAKADQKRRADALKFDSAKKIEGKLEDLKKKIEDQGKDTAGIFKVKSLIEKADKVAKDLKEGERNSEDALISMGSLKRDIQDEKEKLQQGKDFLDRLEKLQAKDLNLEESDLTKKISEALKMADPGQAAKEMRKLAQKVKDEILNNPNMNAEQKQQAMQQLQRELEKLAGALADDKELSKDFYRIAKAAKDDPEFDKFQDEIKKQLIKQNKGNKNAGDDISREMENAADELERLEEDNDVKLDKDDEDEMEKLDELEKDVDDSIDNLSGEGPKSDMGEPSAANGEGQKTGGQKNKSSGMKQGGSKGKKSMKGKSGQKQNGGQDGQQGQGQGQQGKGQGDGQQNSPKDGKPGDGLGGGPGQGKRPYRDGENEFEKQKLKGELRAGAITGISHFKGQGAKGEAPQEFVKALESAEKDSSSALDLERIPADARDMVKDYFSKVHAGANLPQPAPKTPEPPK